MLFHNIFIRRWVNSSRLLCCFLKKGSNVSVSFHNSRLKSSRKNTRQLAKLTIGRNLELRKDGDGRGVSPEELRKNWRSVLQAMAAVQGSRPGEATGDADSPMVAVQTRRGDGIGGSPGDALSNLPSIDLELGRPSCTCTGGNSLRVTASVANTKSTERRTACFFKFFICIMYG